MSQLTELEMMFKRLRNESAKDKELIRSEKYLSFVRNQKCSYCDTEFRIDSHHVTGSYGSLKTSDFLTIPLCRGCHTMLENHFNIPKQDMIEHILPTMALYLWEQKDYEFLEHLIIETHNHLKEKNK